MVFHLPKVPYQEKYKVPAIVFRISLPAEIDAGRGDCHKSHAQESSTRTVRLQG
jgi:hypothetical protein